MANLANFCNSEKSVKLFKSGGREGIRTPGLLVANEALSQLSYSPTSSKSILANAQVLANTRSSAWKHEGAPTIAGAPHIKIVICFNSL